MEWSDVVPHLSGLAHMATVSDDGVPHVSLVSPALDDEGTIWVATYRSSRKARNLAANPRVSIMWEAGAELYLDADVELVSDAETKRRLWSGTFPYDLATFFGSVDNPDLVMLRLTPRSAIAMTMGEQGMSRAVWRA